MGRPLKIAKAQAILTITGTDATTEEVTVSQNLTNLGVIKGMPFITASSTGGLTANTTYWILNVTSTTTFTVSATDLSANPTYTPVNLSATSGTTVSASVGVVDAYFNNPVGGAGFPATNANTYGVVGGNTAIVGKQALCNVAFGVAGTGTLFASTGSNIVTGYNTDFANITTGTTLYALWGDGTGMPMRLGVATSTHGLANVAVANTNNTGNIIRTTGNAQTLIEDSPVAFSANLGGLVTGTTYWVLNVANSSAFTVALTPGGSEVDLSDATGTPNASQDQVLLTAVSANNATGQYSTGDGFVTALAEAGYIVRQKGKTKYLVTGGTTGITGAVYTANVANTALQPNTMTIIATNAASGTQYISSLNDYNSEVFPPTVASGSLSAGTVYTIYSAGTTNWTSVGAMANMTGITFTATGTASGTGTAVASNVNPDVIASFNSAAVANVDNGQPNPIVTINNA